MCLKKKRKRRSRKRKKRRRRKKRGRRRSKKRSKGRRKKRKRRRRRKRKKPEFALIERYFVNIGLDRGKIFSFYYFFSSDQIFLNRLLRNINNKINARR